MSEESSKNHRFQPPQNPSGKSSKNHPPNHPSPNKHRKSSSESFSAQNSSKNHPPKHAPPNNHRAIIEKSSSESSSAQKNLEKSFSEMLMSLRTDAKMMMRRQGSKELLDGSCKKSRALLKLLEFHTGGAYAVGRIRRDDSWKFARMKVPGEWLA